MDRHEDKRVAEHGTHVASSLTPIIPILYVTASSLIAPLRLRRKHVYSPQRSWIPGTPAHENGSRAPPMSKKNTILPSTASQPSGLPFTVKYWGTRGSIPSPGPDTVGYGGNTTCVEVRCGDQLFVIDGGTGVRLLGELLNANGPTKVTFLMSHLHMDHVMGFPFFAPFLRPGFQIELWSALHHGHSIKDTLGQLFAQPTFPVTMAMLQADLGFHVLQAGDTLKFGDVVVKTTILRHPGDAIAYRLEYAGRAFCHCTDWEHPAHTELDKGLVDLLRDTDVASIDATYTDDEYEGRVGPSRRGWGHGTFAAALRHTDAARVKRTILTHHDPRRTDAELDGIARTLLAGRPDVRIVKEGDSFDVARIDEGSNALTAPKRV